MSLSSPALRICHGVLSGCGKFLVLIASFLASALLIQAESPVSFRTEVVAVLSKAGCNAGSCHGNANGKVGFKLSLRGEDPDFDFLALTRDQYGRRVNPLDPDQSLILLKATTQFAHEGGKRFDKDSAEYRIVRSWILQNALDDAKQAPALQRLEVSPEARLLQEPEDQIQLSVKAFFSDGTQRDVRSLAVYEPANNVATVTHGGQVQRQRFGECVILVRFLDQQKPIRITFVRSRPDFVWHQPPAANYIDTHVFSKLRTLKIDPSDLCSDEVFLRRAYLDLLGVIPSAEEAREFVLDPNEQKRAGLIERLLDRPEFADFWALKWSDLLRNEERALDGKGVQSFHQWIRDSIAENKPLDQFAREIIRARGSSYANPAANFYRANRDTVSRAEATAQVFLGTRLQCAQCHNHPFDRWTQNDYYDWAALFAKVKYKILENRRQDENDQHEFKGEQIVYVARRGEIKNPRSGEPAVPRFLGSPSALRLEDQDELEMLADWITRPENPFFARMQVNRIWYHLMGRGIVDPIDDFRATNPASHPELLEALTRDFVENRFDLRHMIRRIMNSRTYQISSLPNVSNAEDELNYSHALVRRLNAEQLLDSQNKALGSSAKFSGYPVGMRAAQLSGVTPERNRGGRRMTSADQFLELFGKPSRELTCECERSTDSTMGQAFQMISGPTVNELLSQSNNIFARLTGSSFGHEDMIREMFWSVLSRAPSQSEAARFVEYLKTAKEPRAALEDLGWSLLNSKEFILRQ